MIQSVQTCTYVYVHMMYTHTGWRCKVYDMFVAMSYDSGGGIMCVMNLCARYIQITIYKWHKDKMMYELGTHVHMDVHLHMCSSITWWESEISMCAHTQNDYIQKLMYTFLCVRVCYKYQVPWSSLSKSVEWEYSPRGSLPAMVVWSSWISESIWFIWSFSCWMRLSFCSRESLAFTSSCVVSVSWRSTIISVGQYGWDVDDDVIRTARQITQLTPFFELPWVGFKPMCQQQGNEEEKAEQTSQLHLGQLLWVGFEPTHSALLASWFRVRVLRTELTGQREGQESINSIRQRHLSL